MVQTAAALRSNRLSASYVVPAAFILILQQTLLLGVASLGGVAYALGGRANRWLRSEARAIFGQALAHLCLALPGLALYLIVLPRVYGFSTLGPSPSVRTIVETYFAPNKTFPELRELDEQPRD
jgi:hypothetical protein